MNAHASAEAPTKLPRLWDLAKKLNSTRGAEYTRVVDVGRVGPHDVKVQISNSDGFSFVVCVDSVTWISVSFDNIYNPKIKESEPILYLRWQSKALGEFFQSEIGARTVNDLVKFAVKKALELMPHRAHAAAELETELPALRDLGEHLYGKQGFRKRTLWRGRVGKDNVTLEAENGHQFCISATPVDGSTPTTYAHCVITNIGDQCLRFGRVKFEQADVGARSAPDLAEFMVKNGLTEIKKLRGSATAAAEAAPKMSLHQEVTKHLRNAKRVKLTEIDVEGFTGAVMISASGKDYASVLVFSTPWVAVVSVFTEAVNGAETTDITTGKEIPGSRRMVDNIITKFRSPPKSLKDIVAACVRALKLRHGTAEAAAEKPADATFFSVILRRLGTKTKDVAVVHGKDADTKYVVTCTRPETSGFGSASLFVDLVKDGRKVLCVHTTAWVEDDNSSLTMFVRPYDTAEHLAARHLEERLTGAAVPKTFGNAVQTCIAVLHKYKAKMTAVESSAHSVEAASEPETNPTFSHKFLRAVKVLAAMAGKTYEVNGISFKEESNTKFTKAQLTDDKYVSFQRTLLFELDDAMQLYLRIGSSQGSLDVHVQKRGAHFMDNQTVFRLRYELIPDNPEKLLKLIMDRLRLRPGGRVGIVHLDDDDVNDFRDGLCFAILQSTPDRNSPEYDEDNGSPSLSENYGGHEFDHDSNRRLLGVSRQFLAQAMPKLESLCARYPQAKRVCRKYKEMGSFAYYSASGSGVSFEDMNFNGLPEDVKEALTTFLDNLADTVLPSDIDVESEDGQLHMDDRVVVRAAAEHESLTTAEDIIKVLKKIKSTKPVRSGIVTFQLAPTSHVKQIKIIVESVEFLVQASRNLTTIIGPPGLGSNTYHGAGHSLKEFLAALVKEIALRWNLVPGAKTEIPHPNLAKAFADEFAEGFLDYVIHNVADPSSPRRDTEDPPLLDAQFDVSNFGRSSWTFLKDAGHTALNKLWTTLQKEEFFEHANFGKQLEAVQALGYGIGHYRACLTSGSSNNISDYVDQRKFRLTEDEAIESAVAGIPDLPYLDVDVQEGRPVKRLELVRHGQAHAAAEHEAAERGAYDNILQVLHGRERAKLPDVKHAGHTFEVMLTKSEGRVCVFVDAVDADGHKTHCAYVTAWMFGFLDVQDIYTARYENGSATVPRQNKLPGHLVSVKDIIKACVSKLLEHVNHATAAAEERANKLRTFGEIAAALSGPETPKKYGVVVNNVKCLVTAVSGHDSSTGHRHVLWFTVVLGASAFKFAATQTSPTKLAVHVTAAEDHKALDARSLIIAEKTTLPAIVSGCIRLFRLTDKFSNVLPLTEALVAAVASGYVHTALDITTDDGAADYDADSGDGSCISAIPDAYEKVTDDGQRTVKNFVRSFLVRAFRNDDARAEIAASNPADVGHRLFLSAGGWAASFKENMTTDSDDAAHELELAADVGNPPNPYVNRGKRGNVRYIGFE